MTQGFQFIAKKLQPHRPWTGRRKDVHNAAAQGDFAFLRHLCLRLIALLLQKLNQVQRRDFGAPFQDARPALDFIRSKGLLQQRGGIGDHHARPPFPRFRQPHQRLQPFADHIRMRQLVFVRQYFPSGIKPGGCAQPRLQILLKTFLPFQIFRHQHHHPAREQTAYPGGEKWLGRHRDARQGQSSALRQMPGQVLSGRSLLHAGRNFPGRR